MSTEPIKTLNGHALSEGQAMTLRVAIENFAGDLVRDGLGDDERGQKMAAAYLARISEVRALMRLGGEMLPQRLTTAQVMELARCWALDYCSVESDDPNFHTELRGAVHLMREILLRWGKPPEWEPTLAQRVAVRRKKPR